LVSQLGCAAEELPAIIRAFGYKQIKDGRFVHARKPRKPVR
jgi:hypothetical protein